MSKILEQIKEFPSEIQEKIKTVYGSLNRFYATVYLIAKNEHILQNEKPDQYEERLKVVHAYQGMIRFMLEEAGLPGEDILADIASDYLEDYVNYREKDFGMSNEEFISIIKRIA